MKEPTFSFAMYEKYSFFRIQYLLSNLKDISSFLVVWTKPLDHLLPLCLFKRYPDMPYLYGALACCSGEDFTLAILLCCQCVPVAATPQNLNLNTIETSHVQPWIFIASHITPRRRLLYTAWSNVLSLLTTQLVIAMLAVNESCNAIGMVWMIAEFEFNLQDIYHVLEKSCLNQKQSL